MKYLGCKTILMFIMISTYANAALAAESFAEKHPRRVEVNRRVRNQEKRIAQGLKDGTITPAQAAKMRGEDAGIKAQEQAEVKANGGHLTKPEQKQLNQELNQDSKQISTDEKRARFDKDHPRRAEVNGRINNQDKRISEGLKDGELTPAQAQTLRGEDAGVKAEERAEVKANGGYLTKTEQKQLNQELNQDSSQIKADEH